MHADVQVTQCCANNAGKAILSKGLIAGYNSVLGEAGKHVVDIPDAMLKADTLAALVYLVSSSLCLAACSSCDVMPSAPLQRIISM